MSMFSNNSPTRSSMDNLKPKEVAPPEPKPPDIGDFQRLADYMSKNNSADLWQWVFSQENVLNADEALRMNFDAFMFEVLKPQFVDYCKQNNNDIVKQYVDECIETSKSYVSPVKQQEEKLAEIDEREKQRDDRLEKLEDTLGQILNKLSNNEGGFRL